LLKTLRAALEAGADAQRAEKMGAYMKWTMPYHGVAMPEVRALCRDTFAELEFDSFDAWQSQVRALWEGAKFREERYCALALCGHRSAKAFQTPEALPLYEQLIVEGAWWDLVDEVAAHRVGGLLKAHPKPIRAAMLAWSKSDDLWKRRTSIICQVRLKERADFELLATCIAPSIGSKEFFLRKAIGWSLREFAKTDPKPVVGYVRAHEDRLSGLSKREALRGI
jgi:3-methyladenine DNA glycosylase AlkD